jgi:nicotinate-nucleotide adenylyltransferase
MAMRLGIFGGTFNPIHMAHLRSAEEVREAHGLDEVWFIPSASPPHKSAASVAPARHRLAMVRRAISGNPSFRVSSIELQRRGRSYSIDTLRVLQKHRPQAQLSLILGLDAFAEIGTWKEYESLFSLCDMIVTSRPGSTAGRLRRFLPVAARRHFWYAPDRLSLQHRSGRRVFYQTISDLDISATMIRGHIRRGESIRYLVSPGVERYIRQHHLYVERTA